MDVILPDSAAQYFLPQNMVQLGSENYSLSAGLFRLFYWNFSVQREGQTSWEPLSSFQVTTDDKTADYFGYGFKLAQYQGHAVIEASNDGTNTYLRSGSQLLLP
jgi:hypothetical protein